MQRRKLWHRDLGHSQRHRGQIQNKIAKWRQLIILLLIVGAFHFTTQVVRIQQKKHLTSTGGCLKEAEEIIVHFTVVCLVAKPLNRSEAKGDLVMIQTLLLFKCKLLCYHAN